MIQNENKGGAAHAYFVHEMRSMRWNDIDIS